MNTTTISGHHASESANRADARVRALFDAINEADDTALTNVLAPTFLSYDRTGLRTVSAFKAYLDGLRASFSDLHFEIHENVGILVEGNMVALRTIVTGTHDGDYFGVAPTKKSVQTSVSHFFRVEGDRLVEHWQVVDLYRILVKIGLIDGVGSAFQRQLGVPEAPDGIFVERLGTEFDSPRTGWPGSAEESRAMVRRVYDGVINTGRADTVGPMAEDYIQNTGWTPDGRKHFIDGWVAGRAAFPDGKAVQTHVVAEKDRAASLSVWDGTVTHTGKPVDFLSADFIRIEDGKLAEHWDSVEYTRLYAAMGLLPDLSTPATG